MAEVRLWLVATALKTLESLTEEERGRVFCWFCPGCHRYVGPGDSFCHDNDGEPIPGRDKSATTG